MSVVSWESIDEMLSKNSGQNPLLKYSTFSSIQSFATGPFSHQTEFCKKSHEETVRRPREMEEATKNP